MDQALSRFLICHPVSIMTASCSRKAVQMGYEAWLKYRNVDASKKIVVTEILLFDFELFIGERCSLSDPFCINFH
jgi:hypothetical protein